MSNLSFRLKLPVNCAFLLGLICINFNIYAKSIDAINITDLKCEYLTNPLGIDKVNPKFSWKTQDNSKLRGQAQTAYQIIVASNLENLRLNKGNLWDSNKVVSNQSVNVKYSGEKLSSGQRCFWKVRVWDVKGIVSEWSSNASFSIGLLDAKDWKGEWIQKDDQSKMDHNWYRKNLTLTEEPNVGLVYVASLGYHELYVNGEKITIDVLNPVSSYLKTRVPYVAYDISEQLKKGDNVIAVWHAAGWTRWNRIREHRDPPFTFKAQIEIETAKNTISLHTDKSWKCAKSYSQYVGDWNIQDFGGELIDARRIIQNWNTAEYDDSAWSNAVICAGETPKLLSAQMVEPQVKYQELKPIKILLNKDGSYLLDMGTNYTGYLDMNLRNGKEGDTITFEISDIEGVRCNKSQRSKYVFDASGKGKFTNRFNYAGGRWITVSGIKFQPEINDVKGFVITSNRKRISTFESSNKLLNEIYEMNIRTLVANTLDGVFMDCPHRERRGWGEVTVAAMYGDAIPNFESGAYMNQYVQYMHDAQFPDGRNRAIINEEDRPFLMWQANNPITVWETYRNFGDKDILEVNYEPMEKWMNWLLEHSNFETGGALKVGEQGKREFPGLGDWATPHGNDFTSCNSPDANHFNNSLYAYMLDIAHKIAVELGKTEDAQKYAARLKVQQESTHKNTYNSATGLYLKGLQIDQAFALISGVTPKSEQKKVYDNLVDKVLYDFPYYDVGSSGQALYTRYFIEHGERMDLIYELLTDTRHPSYSYFIEMGETTWPELWSSQGPSRIHTCYTGIGGYFIKGFGGIRVDNEQYGFQKFIIKPAVVGDLNYANTTYESLYGNIVSNWSKSGKTAKFHIEIPVNTTAKVYIPAINVDAVKEGLLLAKNAQGVKYVGEENNDAVGKYIIFEVVAGVYDFTSEKLPKTEVPKPLYNGNNLARIGRATASSMHMLDIQNPGQEAFRARDGELESKWVAKSTENEWLEIEWKNQQKFEKVVIKEVDTRILNYKIQYLKGNDWIDIVSGTSVGLKREHSFKPVKSNKCRILIEKSQDKPMISEFEIHRNK